MGDKLTSTYPEMEDDNWYSDTHGETEDFFDMDIEWESMDDPESF